MRLKERGKNYIVSLDQTPLQCIFIGLIDFSVCKLNVLFLIKRIPSSFHSPYTMQTVSCQQHIS